MPSVGEVTVWGAVWGPKNDEKQQMHMISASEKSPSLFPVGDALGLRSSTNEISPSSSAWFEGTWADGGLLF